VIISPLRGFGLCGVIYVYNYATPSGLGINNEYYFFNHATLRFPKKPGELISEL